MNFSLSPWIHKGLCRVWKMNPRSSLTSRDHNRSRRRRFDRSGFGIVSRSVQSDLLLRVSVRTFARQTRLSNPTS
jgi:hypothetical protein